MAVRSSMAALIASTRQLIGDVATPQDFLDQDIQDVLDANRDEIRYELLSPMPDIQPGQNGSLAATFVWASYQSDFQYWETDVVIQGVDVPTGKSWVILTPATFEYIPGKWTFAVTLPNIATPPGQFPPVFAVGKVYDLYGAAAMLLERRIALRSLTLFDGSAQGVQLRLSQIIGTWERLAQTYWRHAWIRTMDLVRTDIAPDRGVPTVPILSDAQSNQLLPGVLGADVTRGNGGY